MVRRRVADRGAGRVARSSSQGVGFGSLTGARLVLLLGLFWLVWHCRDPGVRDFPGTNGKIAVRQSGPPPRIATINPDGEHSLSCPSGSDSYPVWSPSSESGSPSIAPEPMGARCCGASDGGEQDCSRGPTSGTTGIAHGRPMVVASPSIARAAAIWDRRPQRWHTDLVQPVGPTIFVNNPDWSPDGTKIAVEARFGDLICDEYDPYYCDLQSARRTSTHWKPTAMASRG